MQYTTQDNKILSPSTIDLISYKMGRDKNAEASKQDKESDKTKIVIF